MQSLLLFLLASSVRPLFAIFDGREASPQQFPFIVLVNSPRFYCAGFLISDKFIVTAAHCLMSVKPGKAVQVTVGAYEYYGKGQSDGELLESKTFWIHENFSMPTAVCDIGLVELPQAIKPSFLHKPVKIDKRPNVDLNWKERDVILAGKKKIRIFLKTKSYARNF